MKISKEDCVIGVMVLSLALNIYFVWGKHKDSDYVSQLISQRDSIINAQVSSVKVLAAQDRENANKDSAKAYNAEKSLKLYTTRDSINKYQISNAKKKIIHYSTTQLDSAYQYLYGPTK